MNHTQTRIIALPLLLAGVLGAALLHQPSDRASAYSSSDGTIYTAAIVGSPQPSHHVSASVPAALVPRAAVMPAVAAAPPPAVRPSGFDVRGKPTISVDLINQVLGDYGSPMAGMGQTLYDLGVQYGIDPAYCLAFFVHESAAGTKGEAVLTHSVGNIRQVAGAKSLDGYKYYDTWTQGAEDWYKLISTLYIGNWNLTTVDKIVPVYAPSADSNDPQAYIDDVEQLVTAWRSQA